MLLLLLSDALPPGFQAKRTCLFTAALSEMVVANNTLLYLIRGQRTHKHIWDN